MKEMFVGWPCGRAIVFHIELTSMCHQAEAVSTILNRGGFANPTVVTSSYIATKRVNKRWKATRLCTRVLHTTIHATPVAVRTEGMQNSGSGENDVFLFPIMHTVPQVETNSCELYREIRVDQVLADGKYLVRGLQLSTIDQYLR